MQGYLVGQQNANLVNRPYLLSMLTRVLSWSKICKNMLNGLNYGRSVTDSISIDKKIMREGRVDCT